MTVERAVLKSPRRRGPTKGDLKEDAILETCERLLAKKALSEIGVDELAAGAGISRPTFYFYFESKDAVLRTLVARIAEEMFARAESWLDRTDEPPEVTTMRTIEATAEVWEAHGPVLRAAVQNWGTVPEMRAFGEGLVRRFVERSARSIRDARDDGRGAARAGSRCHGHCAHLDERALLLHDLPERQSRALAQAARAHSDHDLAAGDLRRTSRLQKERDRPVVDQ